MPISKAIKQYCFGLRFKLGLGEFLTFDINYEEELNEINTGNRRKPQIWHKSDYLAIYQDADEYRLL